jgi:hypothetical protein
MLSVHFWKRERISIVTDQEIVMMVCMLLLPTLPRDQQREPIPRAPYQDMRVLGACMLPPHNLSRDQHTTRAPGAMFIGLEKIKSSRLMRLCRSIMANLVKLRV